MAFVNQFQADQFFNQRIKGLKVTCEVPNVNETGTVTGIVLPAALTIVNGVVVDVATLTPVTISITQTPNTPITVTSAGIIPGANGKVTNTLTVFVDIVALTVAGLVTIAVALPIVVTGLIETGCDLDPNDIIQKHDIQFRGATFTVGVTTLAVTAIVELCLIVSRETIFKISAAEQFCR